MHIILCHYGQSVSRIAIERVVQQCTDLLQFFQFAAADQLLQITSDCELQSGAHCYSNYSFSTSSSVVQCVLVLQPEAKHRPTLAALLIAVITSVSGMVFCAMGSITLKKTPSLIRW